MKTKIEEYMKLNKLDEMTCWYLEDVIDDERLRDIAFAIGKNDDNFTETFILNMKKEIDKFYPILSSDEKLSKQNMLNISTYVFVADYWQLNLNEFFNRNGQVKDDILNEDDASTPKPF